MTDLTEIARGLCVSFLIHERRDPCRLCARILAALEAVRKEEREAWRKAFGLSEPNAEMAQAAYGTIARHAKREGFREGMGRAAEIARSMHNAVSQRTVYAKQRDAASARAARLQEKLDGLREALREAVNDNCCCGGSGPDDGSACGPCRIWHRLKPAILADDPAKDDEKRWCYGDLDCQSKSVDACWSCDDKMFCEPHMKDHRAVAHAPEPGEPKAGGR